MGQEINSLLTGLSNSLNQYLGLGIQNQMEMASKKELKVFDQDLEGKINETMAEQLTPGGGKIVTEFQKVNGRLPTYKEAKDYLDSLQSNTGMRRPYYTVLGYDPKTNAYITHNAADNSFDAKPMEQVISKVRPNVPDSEAEWFSKATNVAQVMDQVNKLYKDAYVGPAAGRIGRAVDVYTPFGDADRSKFRNLVAKGFNNLIYLRSGKQINQEEAVRMAEEFMSQNNTPVAFKSAWDSMAQELTTLAQQRQQNLEKLGFARAENLKGQGVVKSKPLSGGNKPSLDDIFNGK